LKPAELLAGDDDGKQNGDRGVPRDDRAEYGDRADRQRTVEREVGQPADRSHPEQHAELANADAGQSVGREHHDGQWDHRGEVHEQHDAQRAHLARSDRGEVVGKAPAQRGA
jgi:hypothetical protein